MSETKERKRNASAKVGRRFSFITHSLYSLTLLTHSLCSLTQLILSTHSLNSLSRLLIESKPYRYFFEFHNNGKAFDLYKRLTTSREESFDVPEDGSLTECEVMSICRELVQEKSSVSSSLAPSHSLSQREKERERERGRRFVEIKDDALIIWEEESESQREKRLLGKDNNEERESELNE